MPRRSYPKGAHYERELIKRLIVKGAIHVIRGAGSKSYGHGRIDVHAIWNGKMWYFQLKNWESSIPSRIMGDLMELYYKISEEMDVSNVKVAMGRRIYGGAWEIYTIPDNMVDPEMVI